MGLLLKVSELKVDSFTASFGAADVSAYQVIGTEGNLRVDPAYEFASGLKHQLTIKGKKREHKFPKRDQFAPELVYFSNCIINNQAPEPSGREGLADVRVIQALYQSATMGASVTLGDFERKNRPALDQAMNEPAAKKPELFRAASPTRND